MTGNAVSEPIDELTGMNASRYGVYVHFPYCDSKCPYCDFASTVVPTIPQQEYTSAVVEEIRLRVKDLAWPRIDSVYFGGGTPSLWNGEGVARVLGALREWTSLAPWAEVTLEANPGTLQVDRVRLYLSSGVNRVSLGVQSMQPGLLGALGRTHGPAHVVQAVALLRDLGVKNLSLDVMYGIHGQTSDDVTRDIAAIQELAPEHISAYALTLEQEALAEDVPLAKRLRSGELTLPPDEEVTSIRTRWDTALAARDVHRYEISNYARLGYHSRHNVLYWTGGEYLAFGCGATGCLATYDGAQRYANHRSAPKYLQAVQAGQAPTATTERLSQQQLLAERVALGLRLTSGIDLAAACRAVGVDSTARIERATLLAERGLMERQGRRWRLTPAGMDLHSSISAELM